MIAARIIHTGDNPPCKEQRDSQNDEEGGKDASQSANNTTWHFFQFISYKNRDVHGENAGQGLGYGEEVDEIFLRKPSFIYHFPLYQGQHRISSPDSESPYFDECQKKCPVHNPLE